MGLSRLQAAIFSRPPGGHALILLTLKELSHGGELEGVRGRRWRVANLFHHSLATLEESRSLVNTKDLKRQWTKKSRVLWRGLWEPVFGESQMMKPL